MIAVWHSVDSVPAPNHVGSEEMQCVDEGEGINRQGWTEPSLALYDMLVGPQVPPG